MIILIHKQFYLHDNNSQNTSASGTIRNTKEKFLWRTNSREIFASIIGKFLKYEEKPHHIPLDNTGIITFLGNMYSCLKYLIIILAHVVRLLLSILKRDIICGFIGHYMVSTFIVRNFTFIHERQNLRNVIL